MNEKKIRKKIKKLKIKIIKYSNDPDEVRYLKERIRKLEIELGIKEITDDNLKNRTIFKLVGLNGEDLAPYDYKEKGLNFYDNVKMVPYDRSDPEINEQIKKMSRTFKIDDIIDFKQIIIDRIKKEAKEVEESEVKDIVPIVKMPVQPTMPFTKEIENVKVKIIENDSFEFLQKYLKKNNTITAIEYSKLIDKNYKACLRELKKLVKDGRLLIKKGLRTQLFFTLPFDGILP